MPRSILGLLLCVPLLLVRAEDIFLIRVGETWRYLPGTAEPSMPVGSWASPDFDDSGWLRGNTGFSAGVAYGEQTPLTGYGSTFTTVYFRKPFVVADTNNIADLILRVDYDDGFVAILNGTEILRRNVLDPPAGPVPVTGRAGFHRSNAAQVGATEEISLPNALPLLKNGTNTLAIQLLGSGTFDFSACFVGELMANFSRGPFLQSTTTNSTLIVWKTLQRAGGFVEFGTNTAQFRRVDLPPGETNHVAKLDGLEPDTVYQYRIGGVFGSKEVRSDWSSFRTFRPSGRASFVVLGDSGTASAAQFALAEKMREANPDLIMHVGDAIYFGFNHYAADFRMLSIYGGQMRSTPLFLALGNHEMYIDPPSAIETFYLPTNSVTGTEHYYSFDHGDVHFAVAWADPVAPLSAGASSDFKPGSAQFNWLDQDLAASKKPWKLIFFHHCWRTSSYHYIDDWDRNGVLDMQQFDESFGFLARKHGVPIIFNGHDHAFERLAPSGGTIGYISGGGGAGVYPLVQPHPDSIQFDPVNHVLRVTVEGDQAVIEAVGTDGKVFDILHWKRGWPARTTYTGTWHTPRIETAPADDFLGNILGQTFDFMGTPVHGNLGAFTSAGRLWINNDDENLYVGLDEVMLRAGEELFLFLELPSEPGVATMENIGNGVPDPEGEGADGLDFLRNLAFANFRPSIGMILGDEYGDAPNRSFVRSGQEFNMGQGAFYLRPGLPMVPGQRLQQFNRSPQVYSARHEHNANFIEVALPYASLDGLKPGDKIKIGVVTALSAIDPAPAAQSRELDTGGIGYDVRREGPNTVLEGVEVALAGDPRFPPGALRMDVRVTGAQLELLWATTPGKKYKLQFSDSLGSTFQDLIHPSFPRMASGERETYSFPFSGSTQPRARYYRVVEE